MTHPNDPRDSALLAGLFPPGIHAAELVGTADASKLLPGELASVARAAPRRVSDFAAGRLCARFLLSKLGIDDYPLLPAPDRQPLWPAGITGSITHTKGFCGVVVAGRSRFRSVGLDTEIVGAVGGDILHQLCTAEEAEWLGRLESGECQRAAALLFCAKEALFKCQFPLTAEWVDFADVQVELPEHALAAAGPFLIRPRKPLAFWADGGPATLQCRYRYHGELVSTGVSLPLHDGAQ